ncbi:MAG: GNAT family N-acetyltransferase [Nitrososphaeria archaeon]|nr:GNAT family N-acetyltransferase [Nitrososphaeria archaeon]
MVLVEGSEVSLRVLEQSDLDYIYRTINSIDSIGEYDVIQLTSWGEIEKWFKTPILSEDLVMLVIERNVDKKILGFVVYYTVHPFLKLLEIGFQIFSKEDRGKGYATEAVNLLLKFLFSSKNVERIQATTHVENIASQKVLENNGFIREGELRCSLYRNGRYYNTYIYSILRRDWEKLCLGH